MPSHYGSDFDRCVREMRQSGLFDKPFKVRTISTERLRKEHDGQETFGDYCSETGIIQIARGLALPVAIETLYHELAHHMDQSDGVYPRSHHRDSWGVCYARIYRYLEGLK